MEYVNTYINRFGVTYSTGNIVVVGKENFELQFGEIKAELFTYPLSSLGYRYVHPRFERRKLKFSQRKHFAVRIELNQKGKIALSNVSRYILNNSSYAIYGQKKS